MSVYIVRHGQTDWNLAYKIQGRIDVPLNEEGIRQAKETAAKLREIPLDLIFVSPLERARQTADIINEGRDLPIIVDPRIQEEYYGELEGHSRKEEVYLKQRQSFFKRYPGGEGYLDVVARVYSFLNEAKAKYREKNILLVCHGGMSRVVNTYFEEMSNEEFASYGLLNCEIKKYEFRD